MKKKTILIADDTSDLLDNMVESLEIEGYTVIETKDGAAALEVLEKKNPDLIITDLLMPRVNGFEMIEFVRKDERLSRIPILVYSAMAEPNIIEKSMKLGATMFVTKPCSIDAFLSAVANTIKQRLS
jgi:CheY-like chemotaxis protein